MKLANLIRGNDRGAITLRLVASVALIASLGGVGSFALVAPAGAAVVPAAGVPVSKVDICHSAGGSGKYVLNNVDASSVDNLAPNGHGADADDIIPPFTWIDNGVTKTYLGRNWTLTGSEIYANDCKAIEPDLRMVKDSSGDALTGTTGSYTLTVSNIGTQTATGPFTVTDTLPGGVTATAISGGPTWTCVLATLTCTRTNGADTLGPTASFPSITVDVTWTTAGAKLNTANVATVTGEKVTANNTDTEADTITDPPVLTGTVVKTVDADAVAGYNASETAATQGETVDFRAVITNTSAVTVTLGTLTDAYGATTISPVNCAVAPPGTLAAGASHTCDFSVTNYSPAPGGSIINTFTAPMSRSGSTSIAPQGTATTATAALVPILSGTVDKTVDADATAGYNEDETSNAPGSDVKFRAVVTNTSGVQVDLGAMTDSYGAVVDAPVTCDAVPPTTLAASGPGASFTCDFTLTNYAPTYGSSLVNTFKATLSLAGSTSVTPSDTATTRTGRPDLAMVKTSSGTAPAATSGSYFLDVSNVGTAVAVGPLAVTDTMPTGVTATAASGAGWACTVSPGGVSISCSRAANLAPGASAGQITVSVDWVTTGTKLNSATVTPVTGESVTANNTDDDSTVITAALVPDLQLTKNGPANRTTGQTGDYTLVVENVGTAAATSLITVTDTLPAGVTVVGPITSGGFTCAVVANVVTCTTNDDIAVGAANAKTITLPATFTTVGNKANTATASVAGDGNAANDTSVANTSVVDPILPPPPPPLAADLAVKKTGPASVTPGGTATWALTVTNKGPGNASGFSVTDTLPAGVTLSSLSGTGFTCTPATLVCTFTSVLLPTQTAVVTVVGAVSSAIAGTSVANVVVVGPTDATPADNTDTLVSGIDRPAAPADLALEKAGPAVAVAGEQVTWTITVTNAGGQDATGFTVGDPLAAGVSLVGGNGNGFFCTTNLPLACVFPGTLAPGETAALEVTGLVGADYTATSVTNTASVPLANDPTPENNSDSVTVPVAVPIEGGEEEPATGSPSPSPLPDLPFVPEEEPTDGPAALPFTGSSTDQLLGVGALLSLLGLMLIVTGRRRRTIG